MTILIDAGHGGFKDGHYFTDPKIGKLYNHGYFTAYEGVTNRAIASKLMAMLHEENIKYKQIHHDWFDYSLGERVRYANSLVSGKCLYLSIHSNAGHGKGFEVFTSKGDTLSDVYAQTFCNQLITDFPEYPLRSDSIDGDLDKEENFYVLQRTECPAVLVELLFFDEINQAEFLNSDIGQDKLARSLFNAIKKL